MSGVAARLRPPLLIAVPVLVLVVLAGRYGFHRDEWYFVEAGRHPAWSYPDQPPLVPILAAAWYDLVAGLLPAFRLIPALPAGVVTAIGWATSREFGGDRRAAAVAAAVVGTSSTLLAAGHLFSTTIADIALSAAAVLLLARALRTGATRDWVALGLVVAVALTDKTLPVFLLACCAVAVVVTGRAGCCVGRDPAATDGPVATVVTQNYGEAGALDAARRDGAALPPVASGPNGYWWWGPPTVGDGAVLLVGFTDDEAARDFEGCRQVAEVTNRAGVDNDEQGAAVHRCTGPVSSWPAIWPGLQRLG